MSSKSLQVHNNSAISLANIETLAHGEDIVILCGQYTGPCWIEGFELKMCGEYNFYECVFEGSMRYTCYNPC